MECAGRGNARQLVGFLKLDCYVEKFGMNGFHTHCMMTGSDMFLTEMLGLSMDVPAAEEAFREWYESLRFKMLPYDAALRAAREAGAVRQ